MRRLEEQAGIDLEGLELDQISGVTAKSFETVSSHPIEARPELDPTLSAMGQRTRDALLRAVTARTGAWSESAQKVAAAMFDVLWRVAAYERLVAAWELDPEDAVEGHTWGIGMIAEAVRAGRRTEIGRAHD